MAVTKNQEYTVTVEGYSGEGAGVARIDGFVVFVSGALRGEVCRVLILKVLKSAAFAKVLEVLVPSPHRIAPDCPYFPRCGGCTYRHMDYAEELALKRRRVQDNLARIGGSEVEVEEILGAAETRRYRNKAQYPVSPDGRIGFYRARTHEVIDTRECLLVKPEADAAAEAVRQYMRDFRAAGYDERTGRGLLRHVYVRSNTKGESLICLLVNGKRLPHEAELVERLRRACPKAVGIVLGENTRRDNVILGERYRTLWGADRLEDVLCGRVFRLSVPSFYQVNHEQAERLYAKAIEYAQLTGEETVLDLYCGAGTITLALATVATAAAVACRLSFSRLFRSISDHLFGTVRGVERLGRHVPEPEAALAQREIFAVGKLGDLGGALVADVRRERRDEHERSLHILRHFFPVPACKLLADLHVVQIGFQIFSGQIAEILRHLRFVRFPLQLF